MSNLSVFNFNTNQVRVIELDGEPWFVVKDVADVLGYADPSMMLKHVDDDDKRVINPQKLDCVILTESLPANTFRLSIVNESGIYASIFGSTKQEAKNFKKWVTSEVLPTIRKTGVYISSLTPAEALLQSVQLMVNLERQLKEHQQQLELTTARVAQIEAEKESAEEELAMLPLCDPTLLFFMIKLTNISFALIGWLLMLQQTIHPLVKYLYHKTEALNYISDRVDLYFKFSECLEHIRLCQF